MARRILVFGDTLSEDETGRWVDHLRTLVNPNRIGLRGNLRVGEWEIRSVARRNETLASAMNLAQNLECDDAVVLLGRLDIQWDGVDVTTLTMRAAALFSQLKAAGAHSVTTCQVLPFDDLRGEVQRRLFNDWLAAKPANVDRVVTLADRFSRSDRWWSLARDYADSTDERQLSNDGARALAGLVFSALLDRPGNRDPWFRGAESWPTVGPFTPPEIGNCVLWCRGDLGVQEAAGRVASWTDQSGNGNDLAEPIAGNRPIQSEATGFPSILFAGPTEKLSNDAFAGLNAGTDFAALIVLRRTANTTGVILSLEKAGGNELNDGFYGYVAVGGIMHLRAAEIAVIDDIYVPEGVVHPAWGLADANAHAVIMNHTRMARTGSSDRNAGGFRLDKVLVPQIALARIGLDSAGNFPFDGHVLEVALFSRALTTQETRALEVYAAERYAIP